MITKINLNSVACYKSLTTLETDKKVNIIYGLNGTGKSVLSDFLYNRSSSTFSNCSVDGLNNEDILVYNQSFIKDYFYEPDNLKGIFTLSKENREAEEKVRSAEQEITVLVAEKKKKTDAIETHNSDLATKKQNAVNKTWEIKTHYAGGDRVLEYCLSGLMGKKESIFNHLSGMTKPSQKPVKTTDQLKIEVEEIQGSAAQKHELLPTINFSAQQVESNQLFQKVIIGNENSTIAELIKKLENSDWVKKGLEYLPYEIKSDGELCPFCQEQTITKTLVENIQNYFDKTYENKISELKSLLFAYETGIDSLQKKEAYESNPFIIAKKDEFENLYNAVIKCLTSNKSQIAEKLKTPSRKASLAESTDTINAFNQFIENINKVITEHNKKIDNKDASLEVIKNQFWNIMRWYYDQTISAHQNDIDSIELKVKGLQKEITDIETKISDQESIVEEQLDKTVNIEEAIITWIPGNM